MYKKRRTFDKEFKQNAIDMVLRDGLTQTNGDWSSSAGFWLDRALRSRVSICQQGLSVTPACRPERLDSRRQIN